jgi:tetratricopeptide (TPR) repeat protein
MGFLRRACRIVVELEKKGEFDAIRKESSFVVLVEDHDEILFDSWRRLVEARIEVSPPWASSAAPWPISGRHPEIATAIFVFAMIYRDRSLLHEAAYLLREAIARLPELQGQTSYRVQGTDVELPIPENNAWARACLALTAEHMWNAELESRAIERAIAFDPSLSGAYFFRAKMRTRGPVPAAELDLAVADLDRAISLDANNPDYFGLRADLRARPYYPFLDQAIRDYSRAHELDPFNRQWLMKRAAILSASGKAEDAICDYSQVVQLADSVNVFCYVIDAVIGRAKCLQNIGRLSEACNDWSLLIKFDEAPEYFRGRAACLRDLGDDDHAADDEKTAERLEQSNQ